MIDYIELGATLFIPATHKDLEIIVDDKKYKNLKSVLIDTEDSIANSELKDALINVQNTVKNMQKTKLLVFIRPRSIKILKQMLEYKNIENIDGFILPKFSLDNVDKYLKIFFNTKFYLMPSIEGQELFDVSKLIQLRDKLLEQKEKIILVRFGLEDMLKQLKMRRKCEESIFDFSVTSSVLGNFLAIFKSSGFEVSGGVYPCFKDNEGFRKDVIRDLKEGLFSKTIIHPSQIDIAHDVYKVSQKEYQEAKEICTTKSEVMNQNDKMAERKTMSPHSHYILQRENFYGIKD
mgnify:CR=1 FL=1